MTYWQPRNWAQQKRIEDLRNQFASDRTTQVKPRTPWVPQFPTMFPPTAWDRPTTTTTDVVTAPRPLTPFTTLKPETGIGAWMKQKEIEYQAKYGGEPGIIEGYNQRRREEATGLEKAVITPIFTIGNVGISASDIVSVAALGYGAYQGIKTIIPLTKELANSILKSALNTGLDRWIAERSRGVPPQQAKQAQDFLYGLIAKDRVWLQERATENLLIRQGKVPNAVSDTISDIETVLIPKGTQSGAMIMGGKRAENVPPKPTIPQAADVKGPPPSTPPILSLREIDDRLNKFGAGIASPKTSEAYQQQQARWSAERANRSINFGEILDKEIASGTKFEEAISKATETFKGAYTRELTGLGLPPDVRDAAYGKIVHVINADPAMTEKQKSFEIVATKQALDNVLAGRPIPDIPGIKGGSAKSRLLKIFYNNPIIKDLINDPNILESKTGGKLVLQLEVPTKGTKPFTFTGTPDIRTRTQRELDLELFKIEMAKAPQGVSTLAEFSKLPPTKRAIVLKSLDTIGVNAIDVLGIPKSIVFGFDMSYMARQLGISGARHPLTWIKTWKPYWQGLRSEKIALKIDSELRTNLTNVRAINRFGLDRYLYDIRTNAIYWNRPETMASKLAQRWIPGVRMSNRGAGVALDYHLIKLATDKLPIMEKMGASDEEFRAMGSLLGELVGRGELPQILHGTMGEFLNTMLNSVRYPASRFEWPTKLISPYKSVRKEAATTLLAWAGLVTTITTISAIVGAKVERDPRSVDALKIQIGDKHIDVWVGYAQLIRLAAQLAPYVDAQGNWDWTKGSRKTKEGELIPMSRLDLLGWYLHTKESPGPNAIATILSGKDWIGKKIDLNTWKGWGSVGWGSFIPSTIQEVVEAYVLEGIPSALTSLPLSTVGVGVSTYQSPTKRNKLSISPSSDTGTATKRNRLSISP